MRQMQAASCSQNANGKPERRVVVTGMGVVSCLGHDPEEFYNNLLEVQHSFFLDLIADSICCATPRTAVLPYEGTHVLPS